MKPKIKKHPFSGCGWVVKLPDGSHFTSPSWEIAIKSLCAWYKGRK